MDRRSLVKLIRDETAAEFIISNNRAAVRPFQPVLAKGRFQEHRSRISFRVNFLIERANGVCGFFGFSGAGVGDTIIALLPGSLFWLWFGL